MAKKASKLPVAMPSTSLGMCKPTRADVEREKRYRAESAIRTLKEADEIKRDKDLMKDCKAYVKEQAKTIGKL